MPKFHILTMMWGDHYIKLFERACFRSLNWPKNFEAIKGSTWNICTKREHFETLEKLFKDKPYDLQLFEIGDSTRVSGAGYVKTSQCDQGLVMLDQLRNQIAYAIEKKARVLLAPPDTLFGDGTVRNLLVLGSVPGTCVAVSHSRVLPDILDEIEYLCATRGAISNPHLVTLSFKHAHDSWKFAEIGHPKNNSFVGGIAWRKLDEGLYSVQHRLPTVYLADFLPMDFDFFWGTAGFGSWDHRWPSEHLIRFERQRLVGSSDAAMIVEITDHDKNVPQESNRPLNLPDDAYWNSHYHNGINRQFTTIFRGE